MILQFPLHRRNIKWHATYDYNITNNTNENIFNKYNFELDIRENVSYNFQKVFVVMVTY